MLPVYIYPVISSRLYLPMYGGFYETKVNIPKEQAPDIQVPTEEGLKGTKKSYLRRQLIEAKKEAKKYATATFLLKEENARLKSESDSYAATNRKLTAKMSMVEGELDFANKFIKFAKESLKSTVRSINIPYFIKAHILAENRLWKITFKDEYAAVEFGEFKPKVKEGDESKATTYRYGVSFTDLGPERFAINPVIFLDDECKVIYLKGVPSSPSSGLDIAAHELTEHIVKFSERKDEYADFLHNSTPIGFIIKMINSALKEESESREKCK